MKKSKMILILSLFLVLFVSMSVISAADNSTDITSNQNQDNGSLEVDEAEDDICGGCDDSADVVAKEDVLTSTNAMDFENFEDLVNDNTHIELRTNVEWGENDYNYEGILIRQDTVIDGNDNTIDAKSQARVFRVATEYSLTLKNINFVNCCMDGDHAGVILNSGTLKITNCNFTNCKVTESGMSGGAILNSGTMKLVDCNFFNCKAAGSYGNGGAISGSGKGTIVGCNFEKCSASDKGGAVYCNNNKFTNCTFNDDTAANGGAISGTAYLDNCKFNRCTATSKATSDNDDVGGGAGSGTFPEVRSCVFTNCKATNAYGGALRGTTNAYDCNFTSCSAKQGGAVRGRGTFEGCKFEKCSAKGLGGAVYSNNLKFKNCIFNDDTAGNGGAIGGTAYLYSCKFNNCIATDFAPADNDDIGGGAGSGAFPEVRSCVFTNCKAPKAYGGALRGTTNAYNCQFTDCSARQGGAIRGKGITSGCTFKKCVSTTNMGGAIFTEKATVKNCNFVDCSATKSHGGAIYLGNNAKVVNCKFKNCKASKGCGGAVYGNGVVSKCKFQANHAKMGGAVSSYSLTVKSSTFTANTAGKGGAAYSVKALASCKFNKNTATSGGAVYNGQKVTGSKFLNNFAKNGAVSYNDVNVVFKKVTVKNSLKLGKGLFYNNKHKLTLLNSKIINSGKFGKYLNYNTGWFVYDKNKIQSKPKVKRIAGPIKQTKK